MASASFWPVSKRATVPETTSRAIRLPDFFIVGHAKCGTTALYEMLRRHPQIYMPAVKEPQFFAKNPGPPAAAAAAATAVAGRGARRKSFEQTGRRAQTQREYLALFAAARADQRIGEASTFYLWSPLAPARIAAAAPRAKIIAILREPVSFLCSLHLQMVRNGAESQRDLRRALALEAPRREGRKIPRGAHWPRALMYTDRVRYVEQLRRYHDLFGDERVCVLIYDDFRSDNDATLRRVLRFLEVDDSIRSAPVRANPSVAVRSVRLDRLERSLRAREGPLADALRTAVRGLTSERLRGEVLYPLRRRLIYREPGPPDPTLVRELRRRFEGEVLAAGEYLGRDLATLWGYRDVD